jgi:hypothetical protein
MSNGDLDLASIYSVKKLPQLIEEAEARGQPVVITWDIELLGPMPEHTQRLYVTLGVPVRFV